MSLTIMIIMIISMVTNMSIQPNTMHMNTVAACPQIRSLLMSADLTQRARDLSLRAFGLLAQAEGRIHGVPAEQVHFHEVGGSTPSLTSPAVRRQRMRWIWTAGIARR